MALYVLSALQPPQIPNFSSLTECKGFTRISEDSSEIAFLLVENYNYID